MNKSYLPSKKFIYSIIVLVVLAVLFFVISSLISKKNHFSAGGDDNKLQTANLTLNDLLKKDTDSDGVPDWQEALWGTDPNNSATFNGVPDANYIAQKKAELKVANGNATSTDNPNGTETDKFAQEFFASLTAMQQNGQVDSNTINNVSTALGQKIVDPTIIDTYTDQDVKIADSDGVTAQKTYYDSIEKLFNTYTKKGIGDEVEITSILADSTGSGASDKTKYANKLSTIASAYQEYATKLMAMSVPQTLAVYHLAIANSANNTGIAVGNMTKVTDDPVVGLSGLAQYQKYSDDLISAVGNLQSILYNNGVLKEPVN